MIKTILISSAVFCSGIYAKEIKKMENETKIIQVEAFVNEDTKSLESDINKFLVQRKIQRSDVIDIKFTSYGTKRAFLIYEITYDDKP